MKRMHIHVAVENIPSSIPFYTKMFGVDPTILKSDFAISARGAAVGINHLGIQVDESSELGEMKSRLDQIQGEVIEEVGTACCYSESDKYWVNDPAGIPWETFHTLNSIPVFNNQPPESNACCVPAPVAISINSIKKSSCK